MVLTPFELIKKHLKKEIPADFVSKIPDKWEKIGDVVIIKLPPVLNKYREQIGESFAKVLKCKTVLQDTCRISGVHRKPNVEIIFGTDKTETIHKENNIRFKLDPQRVMFSSGNMDERLRMSKISNINEIVVDLFAGVGYFTIPMAFYSKLKKVYACEINPVAYDYLCENIVLNNVTSKVEPLLGDNRETAPKDIADRVVMGYIDNTHMFLPVAINCLKNNTGIVHYHEVCPNELIPNHSLEKIRKTMEKNNKKVQMLKHTIIKSYAPGVSHVVIDIEIR